MEEIFMINQLITQLNNTAKSTGQGEGYIIGCLLDFAYFEKIAD